MESGRCLCGADDHGRLEFLEKRVGELDILLKKLVNWTNFQDSSAGDGGKSSLGRTSPRKRAEDVGRKRKNAREDYHVTHKSSQEPRKTQVTARKSTCGVPKGVFMSSFSHQIKNESEEGEWCIINPEVLSDDRISSVHIKDELHESVHFIEDDMSEDDSKEYWLPPEPHSDPCSPDIIRTDKDFLQGETVGDILEEPEFSGHNQKSPHGKSASPRKRRPRNSGRWNKRVIVWNWPPPEHISPPVVLLPRVNQETLAQYGVEEPVPPPNVKTKGPYCCDKCPSQFSNKRHYTKHIRTHWVPTRYFCQFCGRKDKWKGRHLTHVRTHTGEKPNLCEICGLACNSIGTLRQHRQRVHFKDSVPKNVKCGFCDKRFYSNGAKDRHESKLHKEVNVFQDECKICNIKFQDAFKVKRHNQEVHESAREFKCHLCEQPFKRKQHLSIHLKRHEAGLKRKRGPQKSSTRVYPALEQEQKANEAGGDDSSEKDGSQTEPNGPLETPPALTNDNLISVASASVDHTDLSDAVGREDITDDSTYSLDLLT